MRTTMRPEERLLRLLISTSARRAGCEAEIAALFARTDPATLRATFERDRLVQIAGSRLVAALGAPPAWLRQWVAAATDRGARRSTRHEFFELLVLGALKEQAITAMPLKSVSATRRLYGDIALRTSGDIDVLVHPTELARAVDVLVAAGWSAPTDPIEAHGLPRLHFVLRHADGPMIELHWRVHYHERTWASAVLARAAARSGQGELEPDPGDALAVLALLFARDGCNNLRLASDLAAAWETFGDDALRGALAATASQPSVRRALITGLVAAEAVAGLPTERVLGLRAGSPGCASLVVRLARRPLPGTDDQRDAERRLSDPLQAPRGELAAALRRQLVPTPASARYLRPHIAERRFGVALDMTFTTAMVPLRLLITALRLARIPLATRLEEAVAGVREVVR